MAKPTPQAFWIGLPFVLVGEAIRVWSAGYLTKLTGLITAGPFSLCRNPLYIGSFLITVGYCFMCRRVDVSIIGIALFWVFHGGAVVYEERLLREKFGEDFDNYCKAVPRFFPTLRNLGKFAGQGEFSFGRAIGNDEYRSAVGAAAFSAIFGIMAYDSFSILAWLSSALTG